MRARRSWIASGRRRFWPEVSPPLIDERPKTLVCAAASLFLLPADAAAFQAPASDPELCRSNLVVVGTVQGHSSPPGPPGEAITLVTLAVEQTIHGEARTSVTFGIDGGTMDGRRVIAAESPPYDHGTRLLLFLSDYGAPDGRSLAYPYDGPIQSAWRELDSTLPLGDAADVQTAWHSRCAPLVVHSATTRTFALIPAVVGALQCAAPLGLPNVCSEVPRGL